MTINCQSFVAYLGDLLIPARALMQSETVRGERGVYLTKLAMLNFSLWSAGIGCGLSALAFKFTVAKTLPNRIAKYGVLFYASVAVLAIVVSFAKFCQYQMNQS